MEEQKYLVMQRYMNMYVGTCINLIYVDAHMYVWMLLYVHASYMHIGMNVGEQPYGCIYLGRYARVIYIQKQVCI